MADPTVHITNGVPDSGTGNITTLGQTLVDGANATIGAKADAKSTATDTTAISAISIWKQISASVQGVAVDGTVVNAASAVGGISATARLPSSAATTNAVNVKTVPGRIYSVQGKNAAAYDVFLVLYDAVTNPPVPGTTAIRKKIPLPAGAAFALDWPVGLSFSSGIGYAFTKLAADADTTALASGDILAFNMDYV